MTIRKISSDAIDSGSITENLLHVAVSNKINSAYAAANTATTTGGGGYDQANAAYGQANTARSDANTTFATVNTTFGTVNTNYQAAYAQANTARGTANDAYAAANTKLSTSGGSISGDLAITGNLTVQGNATTINVTNLSVNDSMILLSTNAVGDSNDIGFIGHFDRDATATHAGLIRKATENRFYLFDNYEVEPTNNVIDVAGNNFRVGNLRLGIVNANSYVTAAGMDVTGQANTARTTANDAYAQANTARNTANSAYGQANTATTNAGNAYDTANSAFTASSRLRTDDTRTIAPNTHTAGRLTFGFTSYTNNGNASTYADYLHFRSYTDSSGGSDNLVMFHKSGIGMRIWQQTWNSANAYSNYVDVLHSSNYSSYALPLTGGTVNGTLQMGSASNQYIRYRTASSWDYYLSAVNDDFSIYDSQSTVFLKTFYNGGGTGKYISFLDTLNVRNSGNVGIGTASPSYKLHVVGGAATIQDTNSIILTPNYGGTTGIPAGALINSGNAANVTFIADATSGTANRGVNISAFSGSNWFRGLSYMNKSGTPDLILQQDGGNVGIGTTNPTSKLHVYRGADGELFHMSANGTNYYYSGHDGSGFYIETAASTTARKGFRIQTNGSGGYVQFLLKDTSFEFAGGNVGIGTNNPGTKLDIEGSGAGGLLHINNTTAGKSAMVFQDNGTQKLIIGLAGIWEGNSSTDAAIATESGSNIRFYTNGSATERLRIDTSGNIGIGTTNPGSYKLQVQGDQYISGTLTEASSILLKENIDPISNALDIISKLVGVTYDRKDGSAKNRAGLIAEEVDQVLPNVVNKDEEGNPTGIQYTNLIAYLVESIKELKAEIDVLKSK